uniref:Putative prolylcarboxypeptidase n=1 Tax=Ixodes ricinus TaxID=34613 RepID=A0A0K8RAK5_IXORI
MFDAAEYVLSSEYECRLVDVGVRPTSPHYFAATFSMIQGIVENMSVFPLLHIGMTYFVARLDVPTAGVKRSGTVGRIVAVGLAGVILEHADGLVNSVEKRLVVREVLLKKLARLLDGVSRNRPKKLVGVRVVHHGEVGVDVHKPVPEHRVVAGGEWLTQTELFFQSLGTFLCCRLVPHDFERCSDRTSALV